MAAASPSPLVSSVEKTNGTKLSRLLIDGGTMVLRTIFDSYHPPANLLANFNANYHTLNNLLRRRVLHKPQWDLLFPPGGAIPDSNTFDITLLFVLLTSICGLSPPPSGWHTKPLPSDISFEANLARVKFFRNKLYGHVATTGMDTPTFSALWLEISAVLVALGLPQAEIDRLKAEHCGEEDFLDVLFEWDKSEEDIKSQLKDIRQYQSKVRQAVDELHLTQLEDRKILQDNKRKLEEVHEVQTKTQQADNEVRQSQTKTQQTVDEVRQSQTKTQQTVDEVRQSQTKTQQAVDEVRQSQTKTQQAVDEVRQSQTKTQQTVDEVRQSQTKTQQTVNEVRQSQTKTQQTVDEVRQSQMKTQQTVDEVRQSQTKTQQTVDEVRQSQTKTQQTFDEVRQSQMKTQQTVDEVRQFQTKKTQQTVDEVRQSQCKTQQTVDEVRQSQTKTQQTVDEVRQSQTKTQQTVDEVRQSQMKTQQTVDEVRQSQMKTQQTVDEVRQSQMKTQQTVDEVRQSQCKTQQTVDEVRQFQTKTQQTVDEVRQSQNKTQQTVDEVRQFQTKTQQTVDEVRQSQMKTQQTVDEIRQSQTKTQQTVDEVRQSQIKTQQAVDEVRQNQVEDRGTIQDSNIKLQEVFQIDRETHQAVTNVRETQMHDSRVIQKISQSQTNTEKGVAKLLDRHEEFHQTLQETKSRIEDTQGNLLRIQGEHFEAMRKDLKQTAEDLEGEREKRRENEILKKLAKIDTLKNVRYHSDGYVEGTRLSVFTKVEIWLNDRNSPNRVMVISGNAGMGKSVISAVMCEKMQDAGRLAGSHFCQHDRARHRNPKVMLQSLASQLCDILPDYKKALVEKLSRNLGVEVNNMEVKDLFEVLFEEPLTTLNDPGLTYLMIMDGLDESEFQGRNELLDVIANYFQTLPLWIRFLVTTRLERNIAENLKNLHPLQLDPNVEENVKDIHLCFEKQISQLLQSEHRENMLKALVQKSDGVMLHAHYLVDFIKKKESLVTPELLDSILPSGISSVYHSYFKRLETELSKELNVSEDQFLLFLASVAAAREPLPLGFVSKLLLHGKSTSVAQRKVDTAIACVSALLPVQDECIHFFHKSVKDWLITKSNYGQHHFSVDEREGHEVLSKLCIDELDDVKRKGVTWAKFSDTTKYALQHGVQHMLQLEDARVCSLEELVKKFVLDVELVYAKLCVNVTLAFEDVICVQKQLNMEKCHEALTTLLVLLRKYIATLKKLPHTIFQTLLNEGGPELSSEALNLLETKYSEIACIEYLHKEDLQERVQTRFQCSAGVTCFDVSPKLDYMVCECRDDTIQLWSLHTSKQLWKRDVMVRKRCYSENEYYDRCGIMKTYYYYGCEKDGPLYRPTSLYRSVVFHPTEDLVLPGILSHAYTFDGNLKALFPSSKCYFSICSISADKTTMLTDCPKDAKSIIMWSLKDGSEINRFRWIVDIVSFAWSLDGRLLAISDLSDSICLLDVMDDYRILAQTTISKGLFGLRKVRRMIKFSPDCGCLHCLNDDGFMCDVFHLDLNTDIDDNFSLDFLLPEMYYHPWEFESRSETGFLLGDPFCLLSDTSANCPIIPSHAFVLNEKSVLTVRYGNRTIEMLQLDELRKDSAGRSKPTANKVVLSLSGDTLYVITTTYDSPAKLMAWDIISGMFKPGKIVLEDTDGLNGCNLVAVREGVLLQTSHKALELWNAELSECIRIWTLYFNVFNIIPISEERVACHGRRNVIIVDTTRGDILSTATIEEHFVACNSKCHVITTNYEQVQMKCGDKVLWKMSFPCLVSFSYFLCVAFPPCEQYCVLAIHREFYVLDAVSGETLRTLQHPAHDRWFPKTSDCKFVSDEEFVVWFSDEFVGHFLQLFNVKSGDLLSEISLESDVCSLAACPRERLVAIGLKGFRVNFRVLQVKLPEINTAGRAKGEVLLIRNKVTMQ